MHSTLRGLLIVLAAPLSQTAGLGQTYGFKEPELPRPIPAKVADIRGFKTSSANPRVKTRAVEINLKDAPFSAVGDGTTDDRPALARALSTLKPGDTLLIPPGNYRIVLTKEPLAIPAGTTLWGHGRSRFALHSSGGPSEFRHFLHPGSDVSLEGLTIERAGDFPTVLLPVFGDASNITLRNCTIIGNVARFPGTYCQAIQVGVGKVKNLALRGIEIKDCTYGLFQASESTGVVDGVTVEDSRFERNTASDLEFNAPNGDIRNVLVRACFFRDNLCKTGAAGFAVGFANVTNGRVENCHIRNYSSEALHIEDRSTNIHLAGNMIVGGSMGQPNGIIMVLSGSKAVTIDRNFIDARSNTNRPHMILVTGGGEQLANPSGVSITNNVLVNGPWTQTWYLQPGSGPSPSGNLVFPATPSASSSTGR